ncbi:hypothetical protein ACH5RR_029338 [Cinchona calisaya]|uniref:Uncharacterized protein n=1 Tax=Cinchona calisaya TaxID=153742 RepID=A0ABD2YRD5_9GENT
MSKCIIIARFLSLLGTSYSPNTASFSASKLKIQVALTAVVEKKNPVHVLQNWSIRPNIMDAYSFLSFERATNQHGREYVHSPEYGQSISLSHIDIEVPTNDHVTWINDNKVRFGSHTFEPKDENQTELVLGNHTANLEQADVYGAIAVARYPYNICADVLRAFLELWSFLTNTLYFAGGEMSGLLLDQKMICRLPIAGHTWWSTSSNPYLGFPIKKVFQILSPKALSSNEPIYMVKEIKDIPVGCKKAKARRFSSSNSGVKNFKRTRRYKGVSPDRSP